MGEIPQVLEGIIKHVVSESRVMYISCSWPDIIHSVSAFSHALN